MDENHTNNKIKVLNFFQNEEIQENKEKTHYSSKFEFEKGIIRNAIVSGNSSKSTKLEEKDREKKNCIIFREQCEYCLTNFSISGHLILTKESLLFEPDLRDKNVITHGFGTYQIFIDLYDIYECAHIVMPTKDTYLCNNEDTCGFIQVLLKSIYSRVCDDSSHKKNSMGNCYSHVNNNTVNDDMNKQKSVSYYKYISRSLSYVFNLAQPLVQNASPFKEEKNDRIFGTANYSSHILKNVTSNDNLNEEENENENESKNRGENRNGEFKKNSLINFDITSPKNNIVEHLQDRDLKIYQKINETDYSKVITSHPNITYKNSLNLANSHYSFKDEVKHAIKNNGSTSIPYEKTKSESLKSSNIVTSHEGYSSSQNVICNYKSEQISNVCNEKNHVSKCPPRINNHQFANEITNQKRISDIMSTQMGASDDYFTRKTILNDVESLKREDSIIYERETTRSCSKSLKNISFEIHHTQLDSSSNVNNYLKDCVSIDASQGNYGNQGNDANRSTTEFGQNSEPNKKAHKKYEEKSFILFRFFNNNKAYETTTKIIKEIDEVRKSENKIKKTITAVPFTSNELLRCIIEQSLIAKESKNKIFGTANSMNDIKDLKYLASIPKLEYINGSVRLLNKEITKQINYYLPPTLSIKIWKMAFCSSIHGVSFKTLYRSVSNKGSVILLIYDMHNVLFGCFLDKLCCDNSYYGSGENFLFTFKDPEKKLNENQIKKKEDNGDGIVDKNYGKQHIGSSVNNGSTGNIYKSHNSDSSSKNYNTGSSSMNYNTGSSNGQHGNGRSVDSKKNIDNFGDSEEINDNVRRTNTNQDMKDIKMTNNWKISNSQEKLAVDFEPNMNGSFDSFSKQEKSPDSPITISDYVNNLKMNIHHVNCEKDSDEENYKKKYKDKESIVKPDDYSDKDNNENCGGSSNDMHYKMKTFNGEKFNHLMNPQNKSFYKSDKPNTGIMSKNEEEEEEEEKKKKKKIKIIMII
ncbi:TLD domain-containing protein [Plasmodium gonderi]|uniref:Oxidation resistance protein 1 n=1 Tax=Plasmodium gonderi TaxID=77519 RepID=A0A1Y1JCL3_PLAGO|nr:TLD domain-containing protein [Plasmodium gonderi]GAW80261.1 TLD domain-containing protein [Plasmodium gonderi]